MIKEIANIFSKDEKIKILKKNGFVVEKSNKGIEVSNGSIYTPGRQ